MVEKTIEDINERILDGSVRVVTADKMPDLVEELGASGAVKEVDVVTTGTFGAMCSSGAFLNFGHSDPPIKISKAWLNDVKAYGGLAAVDVYIGATEMSRSLGMDYGGGHVIEDLIAGREVTLNAESYGTDCYPRKELETSFTLDDINQAVMLNPRNCYQRYNAAVNSSEHTLHTYMGTLLPRYGNATFSASGDLSPIYNDPGLRTIGIGTRIFLCGARGYVIGEGTQHDPGNNFSTLMVKGNLRDMDTRFVRGATFHKYGTTLYVGIGIPIPILDENIARCTAVRDSDIETNVLDYSIGRRSRPPLNTVTYEELKSGVIDVDGTEVKTSSVSSYQKAREISRLLEKWIEKGEFTLTAPVDSIPRENTMKPMKQVKEIPLVKTVMSHDVITLGPENTISDAAKTLTEKGFDHLPIVNDHGKILGIITSWDITKALANGKLDQIKEIMTRKVVTTQADNTIESVLKKLEVYKISALPVVDKDNKVIGILSTDDISKYLAHNRGW